MLVGCGGERADLLLVALTVGVTDTDASVLWDGAADIGGRDDDFVAEARGCRGLATHRRDERPVERTRSVARVEGLAWCEAVDVR